MSTHALIIGKANDGTYRFGKSQFDGYQNTEWLQRNMTDPEKVEDFLRHLTEGGKNGKGHSIRCLDYEDYDKMTNPFIKWYDTDNYCCGIAKTKEEMAKILRDNNDGEYEIYWAEYLSYWNGKEWIGWGYNYDDDISDEDEDRGFWENIFLQAANN